MAFVYNISNHNQVKWSPEMRSAAEKLVPEGEFEGIIDVPYPYIPTDADDEEVRDISAEFLGKTVDDACPGDVIYIQGEMSSLFAMVNMLQINGLDCYTATSERRVMENGDGTTTRKFEFVRFRKYPCFWENHESEGVEPCEC